MLNKIECTIFDSLFLFEETIFRQIRNKIMKKWEFWPFIYANQLMRDSGLHQFFRIFNGIGALAAGDDWCWYHRHLRLVGMNTLSMWKTVSRTGNYGMIGKISNYFIGTKISNQLFHIKPKIQLTCFRTVLALVRFLAGVLIYVEFQILAAFERFHTNITFMRPHIAVWNLMLFQCTVGRVHAGTRSTWKFLTRMVFFVSL